jgi:hypothetical protein
MRWFGLVVAVALVGCGHTDLSAPPDAGTITSRFDESVVLDGGRDAGPTRRWCAPEQQPCWFDGWEYDHAGACCLSRQTCKTVDRDAGHPGYCEY